MSARYIQKGESIDYRPETDVRAKTIVPFPGFVGITRLDIRAGELGALVVTGVFESPKTAEAIDVGEAVYYDAENGVATKQKTAIYLGVAVYNALELGVRLLSAQCRRRRSWRQCCRRCH